MLHHKHVKTEKLFFTPSLPLTFFLYDTEELGTLVLWSQTYTVANNFYTTISRIINNRNVFPLLLATIGRVANISLQ